MTFSPVHGFSSAAGLLPEMFALLTNILCEIFCLLLALGLFACCSSELFARVLAFVCFTFCQQVKALSFISNFYVFVSDDM